MKTGIDNLDFILGGVGIETFKGGDGFAPGASVLIAGYAGTGKTTLALSLANHIASNGGFALYVSLEQYPKEILETIKKFEFSKKTQIFLEDDWYKLTPEKQTRGGLIITGIDLTEIQPPTENNDLTNRISAWQMVQEHIYKILQSFNLHGREVIIVIDSVNIIEDKEKLISREELSLSMRFPKIAEDTKEPSSIISLFILERTKGFNIEDFVADVVVEVGTRDGDYVSRYIEIKKARNQTVYLGKHLMDIFPNRGIQIYPSSEAIAKWLKHERKPDVFTPEHTLRVVSTGSKAIDQLFKPQGGIAYGSSLLIGGGSSFDKTELGMFFLFHSLFYKYKDYKSVMADNDFIKIPEVLMIVFGQEFDFKKYSATQFYYSYFLQTLVDELYNSSNQKSYIASIISSYYDPKYTTDFSFQKKSLGSLVRSQFMLDLKGRNLLEEQLMVLYNLNVTITKLIELKVKTLFINDVYEHESFVIDEMRKLTEKTGNNIERALVFDLSSLSSFYYLQKVTGWLPVVVNYLKSRQITSAYIETNNDPNNLILKDHVDNNIFISQFNYGDAQEQLNSLSLIKNDNRIAKSKLVKINISSRGVELYPIDDFVLSEGHTLIRINKKIYFYYESDLQKEYFEDIKKDVEHENQDDSVIVNKLDDLYNRSHALENIQTFRKSTHILHFEDVVLSKINNNLETPPKDEFNDELDPDFLNSNTLSASNAIPFYFDFGLLCYKKSLLNNYFGSIEKSKNWIENVLTWEDIIEFIDKSGFNKTLKPFDFYSGDDSSTLSFFLEFSWNLLFQRNGRFYEIISTPTSIDHEFYEILTQLKCNIFSPLGINGSSFDKNHYSDCIFWRHWYHSYKDMEEKHIYNGKELDVEDIGFMKLPYLGIKYVNKDEEKKVFDKTIIIRRNWYLGIMRGSKNTQQGFNFIKETSKSNDKLFMQGVGIPSGQKFKKSESYATMINLIDDKKRIQYLSSIKEFIEFRNHLIRFAKNFISFEYKSKEDAKKTIFRYSTELRSKIPNISN